MPIFVDTTSYAVDYSILSSFEPVQDESDIAVDVMTSFGNFRIQFLILCLISTLSIYVASYIVRMYLYKFKWDRLSIITNQDHFGFDLIRAVLNSYDFNQSQDSLRLLTISFILSTLFVNQLYNANFCTDLVAYDEPIVYRSVGE